MESYDVHSGPSSMGIVPGSIVLFQVDDKNQDPWRGAVPCRIKEVFSNGRIEGITTENGGRDVVVFPYNPFTRTGKIVIL